MIAIAVLQSRLATAIATAAPLLAWCSALSRTPQVWVNGDATKEVPASDWPVIAVFPGPADLALASKQYTWTLQVRWWVLDEQYSEDTPTSGALIRTWQAGVLADQLGNLLLTIAYDFAVAQGLGMSERHYEVDVNGPDYPLIDGTLNLTFTRIHTGGRGEPELPA